MHTPNDMNMTQIVDLMENGDVSLVLKCVGMIVDELPPKMGLLFMKSVGV